MIIPAILGSILLLLLWWGCLHFGVDLWAGEKLRQLFAAPNREKATKAAAPLHLVRTSTQKDVNR